MFGRSAQPKRSSAGLSAQEPGRVEKAAGSGVILRSLFVGGMAVNAVLVLILAYVVVVNLPYFTLQRVEVSGTKRLSTQEVIESAQIESGASLLTVDIADLARRLETHPWVRSASVYRRFPGTLLIEIHERRPKAILAAGKLYYVDEEGEFFTRRTLGDGADLPLFTGISGEQLGSRPSEVRELIRSGLALLGLMEKSGSDLKPAVLSEIRIDLNDGLTAITRAGKVIVFGKEDIDGKLKRYNRLREHLVHARKWPGARLINLDFEDRALVRWGKARRQG
ncbi:MAG: FtsQ-type POTRA domain-containing protein [Thermodesulfobacteriota bacterium]